LPRTLAENYDARIQRRAVHTTATTTLKDWLCVFRETNIYEIHCCRRSIREDW
jgi:hypothetical protein